MAQKAQTPLMQQYLEIKGQHPDAILFFRLGDFYEMFFEDAKVAARALDLTLTSRDKNKENPTPMCGVPHHAGRGYLRKLVDQGFKVAVCEQVEDPKTAKGVVKRAVTEVITPGVVVDVEQLDAKQNNYLIAISSQPKQQRYGIAALDLSTFELRITEIVGMGAAADELARLGGREIIFAPDAETALAPLRERGNAAWAAVDADLALTDGKARRYVAEKAGRPLDELGLGKRVCAMRATALALRYAERTQAQRGLPTCRALFYEPGDFLRLDESSLCNLEIFESSMDRTREGSLLGVVDATCTPMGGRLLRRMLSLPLLDVAGIRRRQDAIELLHQQTDVRKQLRDALRAIHDMERLTVRTVLQVATPRELSRLGRSLASLPEVARIMDQAADATLQQQLPDLLGFGTDLLQDVAESITAALTEDAPAHTRDGHIFAKGADAELDELIELSEGGKQAILDMEARLRERTGIGSLKVRYNKVFGYFIEVTRANLGNVPEDFQRKQTLVNAERFVTDDLADYERRVLGAEERRIAMEQRLFDELRKNVAASADRLMACAERIALLDALAGLAEVARKYDYCRPLVDDSRSIEIEGGRHAVVERFLEAGQFVPNDIRIDDDQQLLILTGPNMSGKSTIMRQTALIVLLAHTGSFVPATRARIGQVDRIFTRVGAADNLARGESTFMVEMRETSKILRDATSRSLVVLDEIGRGTSTYDGISIAWSVAEDLHDRIQARGLFATHYHELCQLADVKARARNFSVSVQEWQGHVVFLRKLVPGGASRSYGIEVARLAELPADVLDRARQVLNALESGEEVDGVPLRVRRLHAKDQMDLFGQPVAPVAAGRVDGSASAPQDDALAARAKVLLAELQSLQVDSMTPLAALNLLAGLVERSRS